MELPSIKSELHDYEFVPGDLQDLVRWCRKQADFYDLVIQGASRFLGDGNLGETQGQCSRLSSLRNLGDQLERLIPRLVNDEISSELEQLLLQIQGVITTAFGQYLLPPAESEIALNLKTLMEKDPSIGLPAIFAMTRYSGHKNAQFSYWFPEIWRGLGVGALLSTQDALQRKPEKYARAYREMVSTSIADMGRTRKKVELTLSNLKKDISAFSSKTIFFDEAHAQRLAETERLTNQTISEVAKEIAEFKTFVKSEIALKAPVTYWETKAAEHENRAFFFGIAVFILMFFCGVGAFQSVGFVKELVGDGGKTNYAGIAVVAVLVTLILWMLRLVVRLFLSQQHLGADARERTAMVKTYLALKEAGVAPNNGDLTPVLVALFRPSSDGIVKDEAMPPVLAEILTRTKN
jgi:Family of unknown function (DUF6161)